MSNLQKVANYTPADLFSATAMGGAGTFATIKLLQELIARANPPQGVPENSQLLVDIPTKRKEPPQQMAQHMGPEQFGSTSVKTASGFNEPIDNISSALMGAAGLPVGFLGTKALYDAYKTHELNAKLEAQKKQYSDALYQAKFAEETPALDAFCESVADELNKHANWQVSPAEAINSSAGGQGLPRTLANGLTGNAFDNLIVDPWQTLAVGGGALTLAGLIAQHRKKQEKEERGLYPNKVLLNQQAM